MPSIFHDDPTIPPPGKRTGMGIGSILPFLVRSRVTKPQVPAHPDDVNTVPMPDLPSPRDDRRGDKTR